MGFSKVPFLFATCMFFMAMNLSCDAQNSEKEYLDAHNAARAAVGVPPLKWDKEVAAFAQSYAKERSGDCKLIHSGNRRYGENLAWGNGAFVTGAFAVGLWVDEKKYYNYTTNYCNAPPGKECGHYTQVVWRNSATVGCDRVQCSNNTGYFVTCNYYPPGNYFGQRPY
ncbi:pathogenesis-related protein 1C-like [Ipomoea triloba]|uniref:pathogenesis-related protein 1C-like n=1 Tax=Ipomoea triloba TaxID=35885 RepID=UPI00125E879D|nr:pathogenesis-related protein 1C-like [Ipomoea triloba]